MYRFLPYELRTVCAVLDGRRSYGILAEQSGCGGWTAVAVTADLSDDRDFIVRLAAQCTLLQVDPQRLTDVTAAVLF